MMSCAISIGGVPYKSISDASKALGVPYCRLRDCVISGYGPYDIQPSVINEVMVRGVKYPSFSSACQSLGLNPSSVMYCKKSRDITADEALEMELRCKESGHRMSRIAGTPQGKRITVFGVEYASISAFCRSFDTCYSSLSRRMSRKGETLQQACEHFAISRASETDSSDETIEELRASASIHAITVRGTRYRSAAEACRSLGVCLSSAYGRHRRMREDLSTSIEMLLDHKEKAESGTVVRGIPVRISASGRTWDSISAFCKDMGMSQSNFYRTMRASDMTCSQVAERWIKRDSGCTFNGDRYRSRAAAIRASGQSYSEVRYKVKACGMTFEEAVNTPPRREMRKDERNRIV